MQQDIFSYLDLWTKFPFSETLLYLEALTWLDSLAQSAARLWGLGVLLLFSLVVGSAHKYQSDQYLPFVSQAKLEVFLLTRHLAAVTTNREGRSAL